MMTSSPIGPGPMSSGALAVGSECPHETRVDDPVGFPRPGDGKLNPGADGHAAHRAHIEPRREIDLCAAPEIEIVATDGREGIELHEWGETTGESDRR